MSILLGNWKALVGLLIIFLAVLYLEIQIGKAKEEVRLENRVEQQQTYIDGRKGIDNATKNVRNIDSDAALEWLRNRKSGGSE